MCLRGGVFRGWGEQAREEKARLLSPGKKDSCNFLLQIQGFILQGVVESSETQSVLTVLLSALGCAT